MAIYSLDNLVILTEEFLDKNLGKYKLEIRTREGDGIPHFHMSNGKKEVCIRLDKSEYFSHNNYTDKLTNSDAKKLNTFLLVKKEF